MVCVGGDELQLQSIPEEAKFLAPLEGVDIFAGIEHMYRLTTATRFDDPVLIAILAKMRRSGGAKLTGAE